MNIDRLAYRTAALVLLLVVAGVATAQNTVTLTANKTQADGELVPVLTWASSPAGATGCVASGGWSGARANAGTVTLAKIVDNASYTLTCSWPSTAGTATVTWTPPTQNTNGTPLTNLAGFKVYYGTSAATLTGVQNATASATSADVTGLSAGTWYFGVKAVNANDIESDISNIASKAVVTPTPTAAATVAIVIRPKPAPPVLTSVVVAGVNFVPVYKVVSNGTKISEVVYGLIPVGQTCGAYVATWRGVKFHRVSVEKKYLWGVSTDAGNLAAPCGKA